MTLWQDTTASELSLRSCITHTERNLPSLSFLIYRTGELGNLIAPCNANCSCLRSYYYPLCGSDGIQYFSPCFAGCLTSVPNRKPKVAMFPTLPQGSHVSCDRHLSPLSALFNFCSAYSTFPVKQPWPLPLLSSCLRQLLLNSAQQLYITILYCFVFFLNYKILEHDY